MSYFVTVKNSNGKEISVEVTREVYLVFEEERLQVERERNEKRRHLTDRALDDYAVLTSSKAVSEPLENYYFQRERLQDVFEILKTCTPKQRERFLLNKIYGYSYTEIAHMQGCLKNAVRDSIEAVMKKLKK